MVDVHHLIDTLIADEDVEEELLADEEEDDA